MNSEQTYVRLVDRHPTLDATLLAKRFVPPHRFEDVSFDNYQPDSDYPSQNAALERMRHFSQGVTSDVKRTKQNPWKPWKSWARQMKPTTTPPALYLDGGFGVGKTHLLAALWHTGNGVKAYLTFEELTAFIGFVGMEPASKSFNSYSLICIDEFELDDVANTLMVVSLLRSIMGRGLKLAVTSNTLPDRLGEKRFSASEFRREIASIASHFEELRIDGPDYRANHSPLALDLHERETTTVSEDNFDDLMDHLTRVHPVQYGAMVDGVDGVVINGLRTVHAQDDALRLVQLVDKLYDARVPVRFTGCGSDEVFSKSYRNGGYRKKYGRAESRLTAMQAESKNIL